MNLSYNKFQNAKTFSDILEIELKEHISNTINTIMIMIMSTEILLILLKKI